MLYVFYIIVLGNNNHIIKKTSMKIFTKEMLVNSAMTLAVVMVALYVHDKYVTPKMAGASPSVA